MPDLGRWNGIDQLSEKYGSVSPYAYVGNNPIMRIDPDGRQIKPIEGGYSFTGNDIRLVTSYFANGGGLNRLTDQLDKYNYFGDGAVSSFWSTFNSGGILGGVSASKGYLSYWTNGAPGYGNTAQEMIAHRFKINQDSFNDYMSENWYTIGGTANWYLGTSASIATWKGFFNSERMYTEGVRRGLSGNYVLTGRNLRLFGKMPMNDVTRPLSKVGKIGGLLGYASFGFGLAMDIKGMQIYKNNPTSPNAVAPDRFILNTIYSTSGTFGGTGGAISSIFFFGVDAFYPEKANGSSGWQAAFEDQGRLQQENSFNPNWQIWPGALKY